MPVLYIRDLDKKDLKDWERIKARLGDKAGGKLDIPEAFRRTMRHAKAVLFTDEERTRFELENKELED